MVVFEQFCCMKTKWLYSGKNGFDSGKSVVFGLKWLYSGKGGCVRAKWLYSGKSGCIRVNVVLIRAKVLYSG